MQYSSQPLKLGFNSGTPVQVPTLQLHRLVHSVGNRKRKNGSWSGGSGFYVQHRSITHIPGSLPQHEYGGIQYGGLAVPLKALSLSYSPGRVPSFQTEALDLLPWGAKGLARARPGNPIAGLGQFLVELRELPSLPAGLFAGHLQHIVPYLKAKTRWFGNLGSEYLNVQFGWAPFVRDLQEVYNLTFDISRRIEDLRRQNGRSLKRERVLKDTTDTVTSTVEYNRSFQAIFPTPLLLDTSSGRSQLQTTTTTKEKIWFEGRFRYWVPDIESFRWEARARMALFGVLPTPKLIWDVMPWSWLGGWFTNVGDVLTNLSSNAVEGLVAQYGYVMRQYSVETTDTVHTNWTGRTAYPAREAGEAYASTIQWLETKSRMWAYPYGFGVTYGGLSDFQKSILAALAISRHK